MNYKPHPEHPELCLHTKDDVCTGASLSSTCGPCCETCESCGFNIRNSRLMEGEVAEADPPEAVRGEWYLRWFGADWGAPVCKEAKHVDVPVGYACYLCTRPIGEEQSGFSFPEQGARPALHSHRACFMRSLGLGPAAGLPQR